MLLSKLTFKLLKVNYSIINFYIKKQALMVLDYQQLQDCVQISYLF